MKARPKKSRVSIPSRRSGGYRVTDYKRLEILLSRRKDPNMGLRMRTAPAPSFRKAVAEAARQFADGNTSAVIECSGVSYGTVANYAKDGTLRGIVEKSGLDPDSWEFLPLLADGNTEADADRPDVVHVTFEPTS